MAVVARAHIIHRGYMAVVSLDVVVSEQQGLGSAATATGTATTSFEPAGGGVDVRIDIWMHVAGSHRRFNFYRNLYCRDDFIVGLPPCICARKRIAIGDAAGSG
jgi:hypothetical protein